MALIVTLFVSAVTGTCGRAAALSAGADVAAVAVAVLLVTLPRAEGAGARHADRLLPPTCTHTHCWCNAFGQRTPSQVEPPSRPCGLQWSTSHVYLLSLCSSSNSSDQRGRHLGVRTRLLWPQNIRGWVPALPGAGWPQHGRDQGAWGHGTVCHNARPGTLLHLTVLCAWPPSHPRSCLPHLWSGRHRPGQCGRVPGQHVWQAGKQMEWRQQHAWARVHRAEYRAHGRAAVRLHTSAGSRPVPQPLPCFPSFKALSCCLPSNADGHHLGCGPAFHSSILSSLLIRIAGSRCTCFFRWPSFGRWACWLPASRPQ